MDKFQKTVVALLVIMNIILAYGAYKIGDVADGTWSMEHDVRDIAGAMSDIKDHLSEISDQLGRSRFR